VVYLTESDGHKVLFGQDVHGPINPIILSDRDDYLQSLELLISLEADILCEGHFGVYKGKTDVRKFIESFLSTA
jgi:glyoxylase-like metal-dependent hydrolase (beta-lactamase superfamily II)